MAKRLSMARITARVPGEEQVRPTAESSPPKEGVRSVGMSGSGLLLERFGIAENPFGFTPNPRYLYQSRSHAEARASLIVGLECGLGFQALIAPPGMGKTTILFDVLERFQPVARTAFLFQLQGDARDFLRYLARELGCEAGDSDLIQDDINRVLVRERRSGRRTILVIDEAQNLSPSMLEMVRLLSNFETATEKLLQIVLAGQQQLAQLLATTQLAQLSQRISIVRTLAPLGMDETTRYIEHRLKVAGYQGQPPFTPAALRSIWETSRGVPREINTICFNALLLLAAIGGKEIDWDTMQEVIADLDPVKLSGRPTQPRFPHQAAIQPPAEDLTIASQQTEITAIPAEGAAKQPSPGVQERGRQSQADDTGDILEAARFLLEFHAALRSPPPGVGNRRCNAGKRHAINLAKPTDLRK